VSDLATGICQHCARRKRLDAAGFVVAHYLTLRVSRRALPLVGAGQVKRLCSGSKRLPREASR
jgi:hypothetical protein